MIEVKNVEWSNRLLQREYTVRVAVDGEEYSITFPPGSPTRGAIVNALIRMKYSQDKMEAVVNNYVFEPNDETAKSEFVSMQAYRKECKVCSKEIMEML